MLYNKYLASFHTVLLIIYDYNLFKKRYNQSSKRYLSKAERLTKEYAKAQEKEIS